MRTAATAVATRMVALVHISLLMLNGSKMTEDEQLRCVWSEERVAAPKEIVAEKCENLKKPEEIKKEAEKGGGESSPRR